ncbi:MAG: hypothetical protein N2055_04665 [Tepidimonas taiwanensis]|nr:hypothetical protein [Tepidimonas taiwanensis]
MKSQQKSIESTPLNVFAFNGEHPKWEEVLCLAGSIRTIAALMPLADEGQTVHLSYAIKRLAESAESIAGDVVHGLNQH